MKIPFDHPLPHSYIDSTAKNIQKHVHDDK